MTECITTHLQEIAAISSAFSAFLAFCGLVYAGYQFQQNTKVARQKMYLDSLDRYHQLRQLLIDHPALASIYEPASAPVKMSAEQHYYICSLIAFCEGLYLTDQIEAFSDVRGGNWKNFIKHTLTTTAINQVWQEETRDPQSSDFAEDFITFANRLLAS